MEQSGKKSNIPSFLFYIYHNVEDEKYNTTALNASNYYNFIYGSGANTDWTGTDNYDGCSLLESKPSIQ